MPRIHTSFAYSKSASVGSSHDCVMRYLYHFSGKIQMGKWNVFLFDRVVNRLRFANFGLNFNRNVILMQKFNELDRRFNSSFNALIICSLPNQIILYFSLTDLLLFFDSRFLVVLICLIFSVLSTIEAYQQFANETLLWMVRQIPIKKFRLIHIMTLSQHCI